MSCGVDAEVGRALAVDLDAQLGLVELERGVGVDDARAPAALLAQPLGVAAPAPRGPGPRMAKSMSNGAAADVERRRRCATGDAQVGELPQASRAPPASRRAACSCPGTPSSGSSVHDARAAAGRARTRAPRAARCARRRCPRLTPPRKPPPTVASTDAHARHRRAPRASTARIASSIAAEARALGRGDADLELRLVHVARHVLLPDQAVERDRRQRHGSRDRHRPWPPVAHRTTRAASV